MSEGKRGAVAGEPIPLMDLGMQHAPIAAAVADGFARVIDDTAFVGGEDVVRFEKGFARYSGVEHCVGVANGTDALELGLRALDIGPGDEVVLPTNTFVATALAVARAGATPVLVDCDPRFYLIDPERVADAMTERTRAIMPVHLYGQMAPMAELAAIAERHGAAIVEDAAQAQGARQHGEPVAKHAAAAGMSFYPGKNLGAYGDAGALLTNDAAVADRVRALRSYGGAAKYVHDEVGFNSRLDTLQAVVLNAKLAHLDAWNGQRRAAAGRYDDLLADLDRVVRPETVHGNEHVWHLYVVRVPERDRVLEALRERGVGASIHYPTPVHLTGAFASLGHGPGSFPVAEEQAGQLLSLPLYPGITEEQQARVAGALAEVVR